MLTLLVPGPWRDGDEMTTRLRAQGIAPAGELRADGDISVQWVPNDGEFGRAFAFSTDGPIAPEVRSAVETTPGAAVVEAAMRLDRDSPRIAAVARSLHRAGGLAVRVEASGAAFEWQAWIRRLEANDAEALHQCAVVTVADENFVFTCGMQLFDRPDAETAIVEDRDAPVAFLYAFNVYQLAEDPILVSGHTVAPDSRTSRRWLERWPDARHDGGSPRWNPFGVWQLTTSRPDRPAPTELAITIMPPLVTVLLAREKQAGLQLRREEVESIVAASPSIALSRDVAREVERSRGYADIDPELAWEQWQRVREKL